MSGLDPKVALTLMKGTLADAPADERETVDVLTRRLRDLVESADRRDLAAFALTMVSLEYSIELGAD